VIPRQRLPEVVGALRVGGLIGLLGVIARPGEIVISHPRRQLIAQQDERGREADIQLTAIVVGRLYDRFGGDPGLINRWHRLPLVRQAVLDPAKLRRVERRQLDHGQADVAAVME
jgi:hypothetical protein